jgi:hypothetical protein
MYSIAGANGPKACVEAAAAGSFRLELMLVSPVFASKTFRIESQYGNHAHFRSEATRGDCLVSVRDIDVEAAEIAFAFGTAFAQCGHRACLYHF